MKEMINFKEINSWYNNSYKKQHVGLRITIEELFPSLLNLGVYKPTLIGESEQGRPIYSISIGSGKTKVLVWSQMHGNESTGTKAMLDFLYCINSSVFKENYFKILNQLSIVFIPILNPDGSVLYTRENANGIDLNRDAVDLVAKESKLLNKILKDFNPEFCFNLHDQRTIFNVEGTKNPAAISFLAPSVDEERTLTESRKKTMSVIVAMNQLLQNIIPNHVGRYTDEFYPKATGDNFQKMGHHTILIEAGHYYNDYDREEVRKFNFFALLQGFYFLATSNNFSNYIPYFEIPNNDKCFYDIIYRNTLYENKVQDVGFQYKYKVENDQLVRFKEIENVGDLSNFFGHFEKNLEGNTIC